MRIHQHWFWILWPCPACALNNCAKIHYSGNGRFTRFMPARPRSGDFVAGCSEIVEAGLLAILDADEDGRLSEFAWVKAHE